MKRRCGRCDKPATIRLTRYSVMDGGHLLAYYFCSECYDLRVPPYVLSFRNQNRWMVEKLWQS